MSIDNLAQLKALNLFGMATALAEIQAAAPQHSLSQTLVCTGSSTLN